MVLYYGLLALETANNTIAASSSSSQRESISKKAKMSSSSNSWIYTEDLRKHFEERYADYRYILVPIYIGGKTSHHNYSATTIIPEKIDGDNSWMNSRLFRNHLFNSTSKISSSTCSVTNQAFMRDELPRKKPSSSILNKTKNLTKHRINNVVEDDEENENPSIPLIKHNLVIPSHLTTESINDNPILINTMINHELTKSNAKHVVTHSNRLTRLRSFLFKSVSSLSGTQQ